MRYTENNCVSCGFPCRYKACPHYKVEIFVCDFCKDENIKLYEYNGYEICEKCLLKEFHVIEGSEDY